MNRAFSLVELSIVLIIIGLLVAGASSGSKLIASAKRQKIVTYLEERNQDFYTFRVEYDTMPGDLDNATSFFGTTTSDGYSDTISNGNGNKYLDYGESYEVMLAQLRGAGIISGRSAMSNEYFPEFDNVALKVMGAYTSNWYGYKTASDSNAGFIASSPANNYSVYTGAEIYLLERKIDDGLPVSGVIRTRSADTDCLSKIGGGSLPAHSTYTNSNIEYNTSGTAKDCSFLYMFSSLVRGG